MTGKRRRSPLAPATSRLLVLLLLAASVLTVRGQFGFAARRKAAIEDKSEEEVSDEVVPIDAVTDALLAGKIGPALSHLVITKEKAARIWKAVDKVVDFSDMVIIAALGWGIIPATVILHEKFFAPHPAPTEETAKAATRNEMGATAAALLDDYGDNHFRRSVLGRIVNGASQLAKIAVGVYLLDILEVVLVNIGISFRGVDRMSEAFAKCAYTIWGAKRLKNFKARLIAKAVDHYPDSVGRALLLDHLVNAVLFGLTTLFLIDVLSVEFSLAIKSVFAFGSAGTLVFSLASKDVASQVVNGLVLSASDKIYEGEFVRFGDGTQGTVIDLGFMETTLRLENELTVAIPNSQLASQRIENYSRAKKSQVKQTLLFKNANAEMLSEVLGDIRAEIEASCPKLIEDGTRAFRAHWTSFQGNKIEVLVDAHFDIPPIGKDYFDNKETMLHAIDRVVKKHNLELA